MGFGLLYFSSAAEQAHLDRYRLVIEGARYADRHGFAALWVPERHFTQVGCLFPNPAVLHAALARETRQIRLRAGSVVLPLHDPIRVAEEWAMVDNLSGGRVELSFASGWHPDDFVFYPQRYAERHEHMYRAIDTVLRLWRGETIAARSGDGKEIEVRVALPPVQRELTFWLTAAGNPRTFTRAGEMGAHLLTHLFNQGIDELSRKIALYREGRLRAGLDPAAGRVAVMIHTFIGEDTDAVRATAHGPFRHYLKSSADLVQAIATSQGLDLDLRNLPARDVDRLLDFVFERLLEDRVLFGSPETCLPLVQRLRAVGVDELACQLDFGIDTDTVLDSLPHLNRLRELCASQVPPRTTTPGPTAERNGRDHRPEAVQARCTEQMDGTALYSHLRACGLAAGAHAVQQLWRGQGEALGRARLPEVLQQTFDPSRMHSALLDIGFQVLASLAADPPSTNGASRLLPAGVRTFQIYHSAGPDFWGHAVLGGTAASSLEGDVYILDDEGRLAAEALGLRLYRRPHTEPASGWARYADWFYEAAWEASDAPSTGSSAAQRRGPWLIFADAGGVGACLAALLEARGEQCVVVPAGDTALPLVAHRGSLRGVLHLGSLDVPPLDGHADDMVLAEAQERGVAHVLQLVQLFVRAGLAEMPRLWAVTRGAQPVGPDRRPLAVAQAPLWGLGRMIAVEHPLLWGGLVDLDPDADSDEAARQLAQTLAGGDHEDQVAYRRGRRYVARLRRRRKPPGEARTVPVRPDGTYVITGGLGGLGLELARWLARRGARQLVLLGRTPLPPRHEWDIADPTSPAGAAVAAVRTLQEQGVQVRTAAVDVADERALAEVLDTLHREALPPIRGVFCAAGLWLDRTLLQLDPPTLRAVLRPKVQGSWWLHRLLADAPLDFFVMFSSVASLLPTAGQGNYAAANSFLDALAYHRRAEGLPATCINWGPWSDAGFGATADGRRAHAALEFQGISRIPPQQGLEVLQVLLDHDVTHMGVVRVDWARLLQAHAAAAEWPLLTQLAAGRLPTTGTARPRARRALVPPRTELEHLLVNTWQEILGIPQVGVYDHFFELGGHSIQAGVLANKLQEKMGEVFHLVSLFDAPTVADLAVYLTEHYPRGVARLLGKDAGATAATEANSEALDDVGVEQMRRLIAGWPIWPRGPESVTEKNPPAIFVLSPPRTGSTLVRVLLGGHPQLFSPPELGLLSFQTLEARKRAFAGRHSYRIQGALDALQEIHGWDRDRAAAFMESCEQQGWTTQQFYRYLQDHIGGRVLVDKTPNYALDLETLRRAERLFADARYIHLVRHPYGMILSFEEGRMDALFPAEEHAFSPRQLGELIWLISNQNILEFLRGVPAERQFRIRYEDVVQRPRDTLEPLSKFLSLDFHPEMLEPYKDEDKRMTGGVRMLGDPKFHQHRDKGINPDSASRWRRHYHEDFLADVTWHLAETLGYARQFSAAGAAALAPAAARQDGSDQVLDRLQGASDVEVDALLSSLLAEEKKR
jgi:natural product biosynthesis luciferase-like monooxygenase protein